MYRVGILAILHESNTFCDLPTDLGHFQTNTLCEGAEVLRQFQHAPHELGGFIEVLQSQRDVEPVGIFAARAFPLGPITEDCWRTLTLRWQQALQAAGPLDGILVAPHGATVAQHVPDADGDWLAALRQRVGAETPIVGTLDLHANVSPRMVSACDALIGYRTNPHLDQRARGCDAARLMMRALHGSVRPTQALCQLPLSINIERQATNESHAKALWTETDRAAVTYPGVLCASPFYGFPYADVPEMGASVLVVTDDNQPLAGRVARELAQNWWTQRRDFHGQLVSIPEAIEAAGRHRQPGRPVGLLDMGDNVGGGSPGDGTLIVHAWLRQGHGPLLATLVDPQTVEACARLGVGGQARMTVGGKLDPQSGAPIEEEFVVVDLHDGKFSESQPRHGGYLQFDQGLTAVIRSSKNLTLMVTSHRVVPVSLRQLTDLNLRPSDFAAMVLKGVHAPVAAYAEVCSHLIRVNTPGVTCADLQQFTYHQRRRPMEPWELIDHFDTPLG